MGKRGNPNWVKGGPSPNPSGRSRPVIDVEPRDIAVRTGDARMDALAEALVRQDGFQQQTTGWGVPGRDPTLGVTYTACPLTWEQEEQLWIGQPEAQKIVEDFPADALAKGFEFAITEPESDDAGEGRTRGDAYEAPPSDKPDKPESDEDLPWEQSKAGIRAKRISKEIAEEWDELELVPRLKQALEHERAHGGSAVLIGALDNTGSLSEPLVPGETHVRELRCLTFIESRALTPERWYVDPLDKKHNWPELWRYTPPVRGLSSQGLLPQTSYIIHESRLMIFPGRQVSSQGTSHSSYAFWGFSKLSSAWDAIKGFCQAWGGSEVLISQFSLAIWKIKGLKEIIATNNKAALKTRLDAMQLAMSIFGGVVVDADGEDFERKAVALSGMPDMIDKFMARIASIADEPVTRFFGVSPGGLNATGESDIAFHDAKVVRFQTHHIIPQIKKLVRIQLAMRGYSEDNWSVTACPLRTPTESEQADINVKQSTADKNNIDAGIVFPEEIAVSRWKNGRTTTETHLDFTSRSIQDRISEREGKEQEEFDLKAKALEESAKGPVARADYNPDQPRDEGGRWTAGSSGAIDPVAHVNVILAGKSHPADSLTAFRRQRYEASVETRSRIKDDVEFRRRNKIELQALHAEQDIAGRIPFGRFSLERQERLEQEIQELTSSIAHQSMDQGIKTDFYHDDRPVLDSFETSRYHQYVEQAVARMMSEQEALTRGLIDDQPIPEVAQYREIAGEVGAAIDASLVRGREVAQDLSKLRASRDFAAMQDADDDHYLIDLVDAYEGAEGYEDSEASQQTLSRLKEAAAPLVRELVAQERKIGMLFNSLEADLALDGDDDEARAIDTLRFTLAAATRGESVNPDDAPLTSDGPDDGEYEESEFDLTFDNYREKIPARIEENRKLLGDLRASAEGALPVMEDMLSKMKAAGRKLDVAKSKGLSKLEDLSGEDEEGDLTAPINPRLIKAYEALPRDFDGDFDEALFSDAQRATLQDVDTAKEAIDSLSTYWYNQLDSSSVDTESEEWDQVVDGARNRIRGYKKVIAKVDKVLSDRAPAKAKKPRKKAVE